VWLLPVLDFILKLDIFLPQASLLCIFIFFMI
jgi:hypothetical protein